MDEPVRGQRGPAPGPLRVVQEFLNSTWLRTGEDDWRTPADLGRWLAERDLLPTGSQVTGADVRRAVRLRADLRSVLAGEAEATLESLPLHAVPAGDGRLRLEASTTGIEAALARVVATAVSLPATEWARLKLCAAPDCRWAFYDSSRNRSAAWCNMNVCGARAKSRAYYQRHRAEPG